MKKRKGRARTRKKTRETNTTGGKRSSVSIHTEKKNFLGLIVSPIGKRTGETEIKGCTQERPFSMGKGETTIA